MADQNRSKKDLIRELNELRKRLSELEADPGGSANGAIPQRVWEQLAQRSPVGIFITQDAEFIYTNPMMTEMTGYSSEELQTMKSWDLVHPDMREQVKALSLARSRGETVERRFVVHAQLKSGDFIWVDYISQPIELEGKPAFLGTVVDITARTLAENKLVESEERYRALVEGSEDSIFTVDRDGVFLFMNESAAFRLGGKPEDFIGRTQWDIFPKAVADRQMVSIRRVIETGEGFSIETPSVVGGRERIFHTTGRPLFNAAGKTIAVTCMSHDHSDLKEVREALVKSEEKYHRLVDSLPIGIFQVSAEGKVISANQALVKMYGCSSVEEYLALPDEDSFRDPSDRDKIFKMAVEHGGVSNYEVQVRRRDGLYFWVSLSGRAIYEKGGKLSHFDGIQVDIAERKQATDALKKSGETMSALLNAPTESLFLMDTQGILLTINGAMAEMLGQSVEELIGTCVHDYIPESLVESRKAKELEVIESGQPVKFVDEYKGNWREIHLYPVFDFRGEVEAIAVFALDVTARKKAEDALRKSEQRYRGLFENSQTGMFRLSLDGKAVLAVNQKMADIWKCSIAEALNRVPIDFWNNPDYQESLAQILKENGVVSDFEAQITSDPGTSRYALISARVLAEAGVIEGSVVDITERKLAEDGLRESESRFRGILSSLHGTGIYLYDRDGTYLEAWVAPDLEKRYGVKGNLMPGKSIRDFLPPDLVPHALETIQHVFDTGESLREEYSAAIPDGMSWHEVSLSAKWGKDQVITGVVGVVLDITERRRAEESVRQSEERFRGILTSLHETTIVMYDRDGKYLDVWMASDLEQRYGITGKSVVGKSIHDLLPQDLQVHALESIQHVFDTGQSIREEYRVPFPNGEFWHDISISPIWGKSGEVTAAVGFVRDITERKRVEEALRESSEKYTSLFDSTPIPTVVLDGDGNIVDINMAHVEHIGGGKATREDYIGKNVLAFPTIVKAGAGELYEKALKGNTVEAMDIYYPTVTRGIGGYFNLKASPVFDQNGEVSYVIATHDETTERRRTEEALRESEQFSRAVIANSPLGISVRNRYGKLLSVNQAWRDFWQIPEETVREYMAADPDELNLDEKDDYLGKYQSDVIKVYREGGLIRVPEICVNDHRSGKTRWVSHIFYAIKDADGQVDRVVILTNDITVRKQAEEELRESETRFRQLSAATWEGIAIHEDGIILEANDQYFDMFGYKPEELIGRSAVALTLTPDSAEKVQKQFAEKKLGPHTLMGKKKDGTEFPLEVHVKSMEYHGRPARVVAIRDISDHKKAEAALRESEAKFRRITERSFDAILVTDTEGNLSFASPSTKSVLGYDPKGMIGRNVSEFVHNDSLPEFAYGFAENVQGRSVEGMQIAMIGSEGRTVYAEINSTAVVKDGRVIGTQSIVRDISLRRRAEEMLKEAYDEQSRQLRQVAGGLAHDVYNDLFPVAASIHKLKKRMAESDMPEDHRNSKLLNLMDKAVRRAIDLTESVNLYSKLDRSQIEAGTNLASAIDDVVDQNRDLVSDLDIALEILVPESIDVSCPRIQVFHLINNLLLNAVDAVRESETKTIRLSATSDSDRVRIEIEDSGHGIQPEMLSRVFEPFFSTRPKTGTGLGLAIVQRVVDLSGGKIEVESSLDKGTLFTIILPGNVGTQK